MNISKNQILINNQPAYQYTGDSSDTDANGNGTRECTPGDRIRSHTKLQDCDNDMICNICYVNNQYRSMARQNKY